MIKLPRYHYARDNSISFTESEWIASSMDHFIRLPEDTDVTFVMFLVEVFHDHIHHGTIVPLAEAGSNRPVKSNPWVFNRCRHWHSVHIGSSIHQCLTCFDTFQYRQRTYFCMNRCENAHTMTYEELVHHERTMHPREKSNV